MIDWATIAAIVVAVAAVIGLVVQFFKKEKPWKKITEEHRLKIATMQLNIEHINQALDEIRKGMEEHDDRDQKDFARVEQKIEKLTDLMIELIQQDKKN